MDLLDGGFEVDAGWAFRPRGVEWGGDRSGWRVGAELASVWAVEVEVTGGSFDSPAAFVDQGVVMPAEESQIAEAGRSTFGPGDEMVDIAPAGGPVATGEDTVEVSSHDGDSQGGCDQSLGSSHVEGLTVGSEHDSGQVGVT